jgi:antitoxin component HigA of HigAB toxin-antitoxin module
MFVLDAGDVAWVPYGYIVWPIFTNKEPDATWAFSWVLNVFDKAKAMPMSNETKLAITNYNREHFEQNHTRRMWSDRAETVNKFLESLESV